MTIQNEGIGYPDLDELFKKPCDLIFTLEILSIQLPEEYEKESWQLNENEKIDSVESLRLKGNDFFKNNQILKAIESYSKALGIVEQLMLKEKPKDVEWMELAKLKTPLLLNYSQCKLLQREYYSVIELCTEVISYDPDNLKALFRRAKAHVGAWNPEKAQEDFNRCVELDPTLIPTITKEVNFLKEKIKLHEDENKLNYRKLFY